MIPPISVEQHSPQIVSKSGDVKLPMGIAGLCLPAGKIVSFVGNIIITIATVVIM